MRITTGFSARAYSRVLKAACTIADLAGEEHVGAAHLSEATQYRALRRQWESRRDTARRVPICVVNELFHEDL